MISYWVGFATGAFTMFAGLAIYACCKISSDIDREEEHKWNL